MPSAILVTCLKGKKLSCLQNTLIFKYQTKPGILGLYFLQPRCLMKYPILWKYGSLFGLYFTAQRSLKNWEQWVFFQQKVNSFENYKCTERDGLRKSWKVFRGVDNLVKLSVLEIFGIGTKLDKAFRVRIEHTEISIYCRSVTLPKQDNVSKHVTHNEGVKWD